MPGALPITTAARGCASSACARQPRELLAKIAGIELVELAERDSCCGFGGLFSVKYPDISNAIVERKTATVAAAAPELLLSGDLGCLMNIAGKLSRQGSAIACRHVAEVLAGETSAPPIAQGRGARPVKAAGASFEANAAAALADLRLQRALDEVPGGFAAARARVAAALPEFEALRRIGRDIKDHALSHLDLYLEAFERNAAAAGTVVHWAPTATDAADIILDICRAADARLVTKSKSMVSEEIGLGARLQAAALRVVETDLGEYAIQIRGETPSHIIAPAIHLGQADIEADFRRHHGHLAAGRDLASPESLVAEARAVLRESFLAADVGITGANLLVAATGSAIIVTNEGNADLTLSLPRVHIVLASIEKVVPTLADAFVLLRLLGALGHGPGDHRLHDVRHGLAPA